jgi:hypothetical protein
MAGMPAMDDEDSGKGKPKKGIDLAIVFGKPKGKGGPDDAPDSERSERPDREAEDEGLPAGFEDAASEAFPDMAGDTERMESLHRLIKLCSDSY